MCRPTGSDTGGMGVIILMKDVRGSFGRRKIMTYRDTPPVSLQVSGDISRRPRPRWGAVLVLLGDCVEEWGGNSQDRVRWGYTRGHDAYSLSQRPRDTHAPDPPVSTHVLRIRFIGLFR